MTQQAVDSVILVSGARTSTQTGAAIYNTDAGFEGLTVTLDLTAFTTTANLVLSIERFDVGKGNYVTELASATIAATGTTVLRLSPRNNDAANQTRCAPVPNQYRIVVTHGNANSHTYSVSLTGYRSK